MVNSEKKLTLCTRVFIHAAFAARLRIDFYIAIRCRHGIAVANLWIIDALIIIACTTCCLCNIQKCFDKPLYKAMP